MNSSNFNPPQEWPEHLTTEAKVSVVNKAPPIGDPLLDFTAMHADTFEQFCWWLLKKDRSLIGCKRLGRSGAHQDGIDLFSHDEQNPAKLNVFECKAWKDLPAAKLKESVEAFLAGAWAGLTSKFTLILAQREIGRPLAQRWLEEKQRLRRAGIEAELWTADDLTLKVQPYPDILSKFFPWLSVESYANQWMQNVGFYELVSKSFFDPRERVVRWARDIVAQSSHLSLPRPTFSGSQAVAKNPNFGSIEEAKRSSFAIDGVYRKISQFGNSWHFSGPWFSLSVILPNQNFNHASAAITFNPPDMQGIVLTIDHKWLLTQFLFRTGSPLTNQHRGFIVGQVPQNQKQYVVDLPHCRLFLQEEGVQEIIEVADLLTDVMRSSLQALEKDLSAINFPFFRNAGKNVVLGGINAKVWHEIGQFAEAHDVSQGHTPWHMFDANRHILKPYHAQQNAHFDAGYHSIISATPVEGLSHVDEVILLWQPSGLLPNQPFSSRGWWSCEFAFHWLNEVLLPEVKRRVHARSFGSPWKRFFYSEQARRFAEYLDEIFVVRDLRQPPLTSGGKLQAGILDSVQVLQSFFHAIGRPEPYVRQGDIEALYRSVAFLATGKRGYVGYAASKLGLNDTPVDHDQLIQSIEEYIREDRVVANCGVADYAFRAMLEMLDDSDAWISELDQAAIKDSIVPFALLRDDAVLIDRHTKWT